MKTRNESGTGFSHYGIAILWGVAIGLAVCLAVLLIMALVLTIGDLSLSAASYLSAAALGIGALFGGCVTAKKAGGKGLLWGAACGALLFAILALVGFAFFQKVSGTSLWFRLAVAVLCGAIGGVLGINTRRR